MVEKFGGKWVFGIGVFIEGILTLFSPLVAKSGTGAYITLRIVQGLLEVKLIVIELVFIFNFHPLLRINSSS